MQTNNKSISRIAAVIVLTSVAFASTATAAAAPTAGYWTEFATAASTQGWSVSEESNWYWSGPAPGIYTGIADASANYPNQAFRTVAQGETEGARQFSFKGSVTAQDSDPGAPVSIAMSVDADGADGSLNVYCESALGACSIFFVGIGTDAYTAALIGVPANFAPLDFSNLDLRIVVNKVDEHGTVELYDHNVRIDSVGITDPAAVADFSALFWSSPQVRISLGSSYQNSDILRLDRVSYR
jgi:hypothetical protein